MFPGIGEQKQSDLSGDDSFLPHTFHFFFSSRKRGKSSSSASKWNFNPCELEKCCFFQLFDPIQLCNNYFTKKYSSCCILNCFPSKHCLIFIQPLPPWWWTALPPTWLPWTERTPPSPARRRGPQRQTSPGTWTVSCQFVFFLPWFFGGIISWNWLNTLLRISLSVGLPSSSFFCTNNHSCVVGSNQKTDFVCAIPRLQ